MDNVDFNAYVSDVLTFIRTMVIKCEQVAIVDNNLLIGSGYPVSQDRSTWRYYLNLSGQYHPKDSVMSVESLDNGSIIIFNQENLANHPATKRAYLSGDYAYKQLLATFPDQQYLIDGILNPIDLKEAVNAVDYKILRYNADLVLWNEDQLIPSLQDWINAFANQHFSNDYFYTDNLMLPITLATLYGLAIPTVLNIREGAVGTRYAHDFHVWAKLNSHGDLGKYKPYLNNEQTMWLYRNIEWIVNNAGKAYTLDALIKNLLSPRSIPLSRFVAMLNTEHQLDDLTPAIGFKKIDMNLALAGVETPLIYTPADIVAKEALLAKDNALNMDASVAEITRQGNAALMSGTPTKLLESSMEDYTNRHAQTLFNTLYHHWVYLVKNNYYNAIIDTAMPGTGVEVRMSTKNALIFWTWLTKSLRGEDTTYVPNIEYHWALKIKPPSTAQLQVLGDSRYITPLTCQNVVGLHPGYSKLISPDTFYNKVFSIYLVQKKLRFMYAQWNDFNKVARVKRVCDEMSESGLYTPQPGLTYAAWFESMELSIPTLSTDELRDLAWDIFQKATGLDSNLSLSLRSIQENLINLMMDLSSYTIQTSVVMDDGTVTVEADTRVDAAFTYDAPTMAPDPQSAFFPTDLHAVPEFVSINHVKHIAIIQRVESFEFNNALVARLPLSTGAIMVADNVSSVGFLPMSLHVTDPNSP